MGNMEARSPLAVISIHLPLTLRPLSSFAERNERKTATKQVKANGKQERVPGNTIGTRCDAGQTRRILLTYGNSANEDMDLAGDRTGPTINCARPEKKERKNKNGERGKRTENASEQKSVLLK